MGAARVSRGAHSSTKTGDVAFTLNASAEIVDWSASAHRVLGYRRDEAVGRRCHDVLACRDQLGQALCAETCSLLQAIQEGRPVAATDSVVFHRSGRALEVSAAAAQVVDNSDAVALVLVRPTPSGIVDLPPWVQEEPPAESGYGPHEDPASHLDFGSILDRLLFATGADAAELFLMDPAGRHLLLMANRGDAPRAFREIVRFEIGQGFPGLVAQIGEPLLTDDLSHDVRLLRRSVGKHGFQDLVCVPIRGGGSYLGSLHIASRRHGDQIRAQLPFMMRVASHLGKALELVRLRTAERLAGEQGLPTGDADANLRYATDHALATLMNASGTDCGALLLIDDATQTLQLVNQQNLPPRLHHLVTARCSPAVCPAIAQQSSILVTDREGAATLPPSCRALQRHLPFTICVPLSLAGRPLGAAMLGLRRSEPLPAHHLSLLHATLNRVAVTLHSARLTADEEHEVRARAERAVANGSQPAYSRPIDLPTDVAGTPFLDLHCLGQFTIVRDGLPVPLHHFARRRSLTLLKILLTRYGKPVHREELIDLLWPEADPQSATGLLKVVVHYLRRGLAPSIPAGHPSPFIVTNGDYYAFNTQSPHRLDTHDFLESADLAVRLEAGGQSELALASYCRAIDHYAGDFLEEERYSDWCALEREYLRERFLTVLRRAAELQLRRGEVEAAVTVYRRALQTDGSLEDIHRGLMEALWRTGRRDEALRQYQTCRTMLERELGATPMPQTEALRSQIAQGRSR